MKKDTPPGIYSVKINNHRQSKHVISATVATKRQREEKGKKARERKKMWDNAQRIPSSVEEEFKLIFHQDPIYLGRDGWIVGAAVKIGPDEKKAFLIPTDGWLNREEIQFGKEYRCAILKETHHDPYGRIPVYYVCALEDTTKKETSSVTTESAIVFPTVSPETHNAPPTIRISVVKTEMVFSDAKVAGAFLSSLKGRAHPERTQHLSEDEKKQVTNEAKLQSFSWIQVGNVLICLFPARIEETVCKEYELCLERFFNKLDIDKMLATLMPITVKKATVIIAKSKKRKPASKK